MEGQTITLYENHMAVSEMGNLRYEGPKPITVEDGLAISILKWTTIVAWLESHPRSSLWDSGSFTCGLCMMYIHNEHCAGCPIAADGHYYCMNTPYVGHHEAYDNEDWEQQIYHARAEVEYLRRIAHGYIFHLPGDDNGPAISERQDLG